MITFIEDVVNENPNNVQISIHTNDKNDWGSFYDGGDIFGDKRKGIKSDINSKDFKGVSIGIYEGDDERGYLGIINQKGDIELETEN